MAPLEMFLMQLSTASSSMLWIWVLCKCTDCHKILDVRCSEHHCAYSFSVYLYQPAIYGKISCQRLCVSQRTPVFNSVVNSSELQWICSSKWYFTNIFGYDLVHFNLLDGVTQSNVVW